MDETVLANSKGATYMSFILDVEVVIKKDGERVNLAENILKEKKRSSKDNENKKKTSQPKENTKVYTLETDTRNIFKDGEKQMITENKLLSDMKIHLTEDASTKHNKEPNDNQKELVSYEHFKKNPRNSFTNKIRKKKTDRKSRVFKGKIEAIDFFECNRIFMCNYLRITNLNWLAKVPYFLKISRGRKHNSKFTLSSGSYFTKSSKYSSGDCNMQEISNTEINGIIINKRANHKIESNKCCNNSFKQLREQYIDRKLPFNEGNILETQKIEYRYSHENLSFNIPEQNRTLRQFKSMPTCSLNQPITLNSALNISYKSNLNDTNNLKCKSDMILFKRALLTYNTKNVINGFSNKIAILQSEDKIKTNFESENKTTNYCCGPKFSCYSWRKSNSTDSNIETESNSFNDKGNDCANLLLTRKLVNGIHKTQPKTIFHHSMKRGNQQKTVFQRILGTLLNCVTIKCYE